MLIRIFLLLLPFSFCFTQDKWIVVTTIQAPTPQLQKLANIPGWRLLVVGDLKTPKDWSLDNCVYISPQKQLELGYRLAELLPWNHYTRKNIGYLYAIEHGAKVIYDTDDDNEPIDGLNPLAHESSLPQFITSGNVINIYAYFGQPGVWPRGFPLDKIANPPAFSLSAPTYGTVGMEQGVVNGSPDVDAIFRLTQDRPIAFQPSDPCYLPKGVFSPTNSQNTFIHPEAFFTLYLPSHCAFRVTDIWRGFIAQRLLWEVGSKLAVSGPSAFQERNYHLLLKDFSQEIDIYLKTDALLQYLLHWQFETFDHFQDALPLYSGLVEKGFLQKEEIPLVEAWFADLTNALYISARHP